MEKGEFKMRLKKEYMKEQTLEALTKSNQINFWKQPKMKRLIPQNFNQTFYLEKNVMLTVLFKVSSMGQTHLSIQTLLSNAFSKN